MNGITVPMDEPKLCCNSTLSTASHISRSELLKRRFQNLKRLSKCYRDLYWQLMEQVKTLYRHYLYHYALNPFSHFHFPTCSFLGCNLKPMPFTSFCHFHILSIPTRSFISPAIILSKVLVSSPLPLKPNMKERAEAGSITCGKPILRCIIPALCTVHSHKAQKHLARALKRNSRNISSTTNTAPKFHALVSEYVKHIQARRKEQLENKSKTVFKDRMITA